MVSEIQWKPFWHAALTGWMAIDHLCITPWSLFSGPPDQSTWMFTQSLIQEWSGRVFWYAAYAWRHYANGLFRVNFDVITQASFQPQRGTFFSLSSTGSFSKIIDNHREKPPIWLWMLELRYSFCALISGAVDPFMSRHKTYTDLCTSRKCSPSLRKDAQQSCFVREVRAWTEAKFLLP